MTSAPAPRPGLLAILPAMVPFIVTLAAVLLAALFVGHSACDLDTAVLVPAPRSPGVRPSRGGDGAGVQGRVHPGGSALYPSQRTHSRFVGRVEDARSIVTPWDSFALVSLGRPGVVGRPWSVWPVRFVYCARDWPTLFSSVAVRRACVFGVGLGSVGGMELREQGRVRPLVASSTSVRCGQVGSEESAVHLRLCAVWWPARLRAESSDVRGDR